VHLALVAVLAGSAAGDPLPAEPVVPAPRAPPLPPLVVEVLAGGGLNFQGAEAGAIGMRVMRRAWSVGLDLEVAAPETHEGVDVWRGAVTASACRHLSLLALCPMAQAGFVHSDPLVAFGARLALELQITRRLAVRLRFDERVRATSAAYIDRFESWLAADLVVRVR